MATKPPVILHQAEPCEVLACGGLPEGTGRVRLRRGAGRLGCTRRSCSPLPVQIAQRLVQRDILLATVAGTQATLLLLAPSALRLLLASALLFSSSALLPSLMPDATAIVIVTLSGTH